jgi:hypothetical protein
MITRKHLLLAIGATCLLTMFAISIVPIRSQTGAKYDPWLDVNGDGKMDGKDIALPALIYGTAGEPTKNVNVTNWPSQLLSNYVYDSGPLTLGPYPNNDSWTYRDLPIAGYRQVSVFVSFDNIPDVQLEIRVGMGDFTGAHPGGSNWATYYNITPITGQVQPPFTQTVDVRGPQLTVEVYNGRSYSMDYLHIVVYVTC